MLPNVRCLISSTISSTSFSARRSAGSLLPRFFSALLSSAFFSCSFLSFSRTQSLVFSIATLSCATSSACCAASFTRRRRSANCFSSSASTGLDKSTSRFGLASTGGFFAFFRAGFAGLTSSSESSSAVKRFLADEEAFDEALRLLDFFRAPTSPSSSSMSNSSSFLSSGTAPSSSKSSSSSSSSSSAVEGFSAAVDFFFSVFFAFPDGGGGGGGAAPFASFISSSCSCSFASISA
mmetsp:Transcript_3156/g.8133  ORF Transcript_3156/g.8133 Transcript_3156/m.8133 type:complete len:236 (+) Transcript_3156:701-1408(+)